MTTETLLYCIGSGMIGAGIVLWGQAIRNYLRDRRALARRQHRPQLVVLPGRQPDQAARPTVIRVRSGRG